MDKDTLDDAKEDFKRCHEAEADQRRESKEDLEFARLGRQWPEDVKTQREKEGRPCLTINRLPAFIKQVTNDARQNRPSITVHPVGDGADKETAEILNGLIRNIQNVSRADICYDTALDFAVTMGFGYWVIRDQYTHEDSFDKDLVIERVSNPFSVYGDYESKEATSVDWNRAFITDIYPKDTFKRKWPGADAAGFEVENGGDDVSLWFSDEGIRVAEHWTRDETLAKLLKLSSDEILQEAEFLKDKDLFAAQGITVVGDRMARSYKVRQQIITGVDILETNEWLGKYIPIVPVYGDEINVAGKRYFQGLVRFAKDPQRMFNYWRTAATELVALAPKAPFIGPVGAFATDQRWGSANTTSYPYLEYDPVDGLPPPQRQPFAGVPAGALQEALNASDDMKNIMGLHDASLGARSNETSGKAIMARQREGDVSTFNFTDNLTRAIEHTGTILVDLIPKHYTAARMVRCIKEDGSNYAVPVNQPVVPKQPEPGNEPTPGQQQQDYEPAQEEMEGLTRVFDLTTGKYDVTVAAGPSFTTKRQEASESMMEFIRVFPASAPLIGDLVAKNQDWPGADEVSRRLKAMLPQQVSGGMSPREQQLQQALQQQDAHAREAVQELSGKAQKAEQELQALKADRSIESYQADTDRIKALADAHGKGLQVTVAADGSMTAIPLAMPQQQNTPEQPPGM